MRDDRTWVADATDLDWIEAASVPPIEALLAMEAHAEQHDVPIVDRVSGRVLGLLAAGRRRIVEVGTAIGYSTLWLALGQPADGTIVTIDPDAERTDRARAWWREAGIADERIRIVTAPALDAFAAGRPELEGPFDLAFIDALKPEYGAYLEALLPRLAPGALVVADNVLWSGRVARSAADGDAGTAGDERTAALRRFDEATLRDPRLEMATILPVGDGLLAAVVRG